MIAKPENMQDNPFEHCWDRLTAAVDNRNDPWRTPALATSDASGPAVRTVVLRGAEQGCQRLDFHTDCRAQKVLQINNHEDVAWMFYDAFTKEQLRCRGPVRIHSGDASALQAWEQLNSVSRLTYAQGPKPGEPWDTNGQGTDRLRDSASQERTAFANFMLVRCTVRCMDWLQLGETANVRILMRPGPQGWLSQRVAP